MNLDPTINGDRFDDPDAYCDALLGILTGMGQDCFDEEVTQLEHALQTATLAEADRASDELVVASLLHDIGHLLLGPIPERRDRDLEHDRIGARFLTRRFGSGVAGPVALHVQAKRYLVAVDERYARRLSDASARTLDLQGGPLARSEASRFAQLPHAGDAVTLRRWDDRAKVPGRQTPDLAYWRPFVRRLL